MRIPAIAELGTQSSSLTRDGLMTNCFPEKREGQWEVAKRTGQEDPSILSPSLAGYGLYYWETDGKVWSAAGTKIYRDATDKSVTITAAQTGFAEAGSVTKKLFVEAGTAAWSVASDGTMTALSGTYTSTVAASPGTINTPVELDGYMFVGRADGRIFHSDNVDEDPANLAVWDVDNYIAVTESDTLYALVRHNAFIAAIGDKAVEFFYDAANENGSVLAPVQGQVIRMGTFGKATVARMADVFFYVSTISDGGYVVVMVESLKPKIISTPQVSRILGSGTGHQTMSAMCCNIGEHHLYILTVGSNVLAYDIASQQWIKVDPWPWCYATVKNGDTLLQHGTNGAIGRATAGFQDWVPGTGQATITMTVRSPAMQFNSPMRKTMKAVALEANKGSTAFTFRYSDDDYANWSTARTFPLVRPVLYGLGQFLRRAMEISHAGNEDARIQAVHIET